MSDFSSLDLTSFIGQSTQHRRPKKPIREFRSRKYIFRDQSGSYGYTREHPPQSRCAMRFFAAPVARGPTRGSCSVDLKHVRPQTVQSSSQRKPPAPLTQRCTKPKSLSARKVSKRKKNVVHPIDKRDLEVELEQYFSTLKAEQDATHDEELNIPTTGFTVNVSVLHALDLHNPCLVRSCPHSFEPVVQLSVNGSAVESFRASHNARNHSSWNKSARTNFKVGQSGALCLQVLRVDVVANCTRQPGKLTAMGIGSSDDIVLSPQVGEVSRFHPIYRYQTLQNGMVKYFAGKVKLTISITHEELSYVTKVNTSSECVNTPEQASSVPSSSQSRPTFLPPNFGQALQLKRAQLKATVLPETATVAKATTGQAEKCVMMDNLRAKIMKHAIRQEDVSVISALGEGIHANVLHVQVNNQDMAMKEYRYNADNDSLPPFAVLRSFQQEYEMISLVSSCCFTRHTIRILGAMLTPRLAIFTDFCGSGSLARCLADYTTWSRISFPMKLELARQIADGLASLHQQNIVHRDIKSHNIFLEGLLTSPVAKIGDFGSAVVTNPTDSLLHDQTGSSGYTAPEVFRSCGYDWRADIWSLGVVMWEIFTQNAIIDDGRQIRNPFAGAHGDQVVHLAESGERPTIPVDYLPLWCESMLRRCWSFDSSLRPTAAAIASEIAIAGLSNS